VVSASSHPLHGAWRVDAIMDGKSTRPNGKGMIYCAPSGDMVCQVSPGNAVKKVGAKSTPDEALAALDGYIAYFGTFTIDERARTVTHHRQGSVQPGDTADLVRKFTIDGDKLTLNPPGTTYEVIWKRIS
jgi:Lipocalin-like domain